MKLDPKNILKDISIMIVDDYVDLVDSMVNYLSDYTSCIYSAGNGEEGLTVFEKYSPDIVVTDINMPVMDGLQMAQKIRDWNENVPIIVMTGYNEASLMVKGMQIGLDKFLLKPVDLNILLNILIQNAESIVLKKESSEELSSFFQSLDINPNNLAFIKEGKIKYINKALRKLLQIDDNKMPVPFHDQDCTRDLETLPCFHELGGEINKLENEMQTEQYFCYCNKHKKHSQSVIYSGSIIPLKNKKHFLVNIQPLAGK